MAEGGAGSCLRRNDGGEAGMTEVWMRLGGAGCRSAANGSGPSGPLKQKADHGAKARDHHQLHSYLECANHRPELSDHAALALGLPLVPVSEPLIMARVELGPVSVSSSHAARVANPAISGRLSAAAAG